MIGDLEVGTLVLLTFDTSGSIGVTKGMTKYDGRKFRISKVRKLIGQTMANRGVYYELKGCESEHGIPYAISPLWVQPIREIKRK